MNLPAEIQDILQKIVEAVRPLQVYLFGSYASGNNTIDSDFDFYVVVPNDAGRKMDISQKAYKAIWKTMKTPVDILIGHEATFAERCKFNTIEKAVLEEGVLLYDRCNDSF